MPILVWADDDRSTDPALTGAKASTLARIARWPDGDRPELSPAAVLTTAAWSLVVEHLGLRRMVEQALAGEGGAARELAGALGSAPLPDPVEQAIAEVVQHFEELGGSELAVRSSAVAEDQVDRSFAGQYTTRLRVSGVEQASAAYRACLSSAWLPGAQAYREATAVPGVDAPAMAVLVQPMVHVGGGWAGAAVSDGAGGVVVEAVRGLGDALMAGRADPLRWVAATDESPDGAMAAEVVRWVRRAERRLGRPVEVEFALRPGSSTPVVLQLRPHHPSTPATTMRDRWRRPSGAVDGLSVGSGRAAGPVCRLDGPEEIDRLLPGGVLVTSSTDPTWLPLLAGLGAVVTDHGGLTSHAAIVCRELGLLAVVGCGDATRRLPHGAMVEVRCDGPNGSVSLLS